MLSGDNKKGFKTKPLLNSGDILGENGEQPLSYLGKVNFYMAQTIPSAVSPLSKQPSIPFKKMPCYFPKRAFFRPKSPAIYYHMLRGAWFNSRLYLHC